MDASTTVFKSAFIQGYYFCGSCARTLSDPFQVAYCGAILCKYCFENVNEKGQNGRRICLICQKPVIISSIEAGARFVNEVKMLQIRCKFHAYGCMVRQRTAHDDMEGHQKICRANPKLKACQNGCGAMIGEEGHVDHNCISYFRSAIEDMKEEFMESNLQKATSTLNNEIIFLKSTIEGLALKLAGCKRETYLTTEVLKTQFANQETRMAGILFLNSERDKFKAKVRSMLLYFGHWKSPVLVKQVEKLRIEVTKTKNKLQDLQKSPFIKCWARLLEMIKEYENFENALQPMGDEMSQYIANMYGLWMINVKNRGKKHVKKC